MGDTPISLIILMVIVTVVIVCVLAGLTATFGVVGLATSSDISATLSAAAQDITQLFSNLLAS